MKRITIKDIAKALGYSPGTISKALADSYEISNITKIEIQKYANENGYSFNHYAKLLRTGRTNIIGMIVPAIGNSFFSQILEGIEEQMSKTAYNLLIMQSNDDPVCEMTHLETLYKKGADAIVITPTGNRASMEYLKKLKDEGIPVVLMDRTNYNIDTHKIGIDNYAAVYKSITHLINQGRTNILFISSFAKGVVEERRRGYLQCLRDYNIQYHSKNLLSIDVGKKGRKSQEELMLYLSQKMKSELPPDAIFTASDQLTYQTLEVLHALHIEVPAQLSLIGFANFRFTNIFEPPLSCIVQPSKEMGAQAFLLLSEILENQSQKTTLFKNIKLAASVEIRQSS